MSHDFQHQKLKKQPKQQEHLTNHDHNINSFAHKQQQEGKKFSLTQITTPNIGTRNNDQNNNDIMTKTKNFQTEVQLTIHHNSGKKENNEELQKHLWLGSCYNSWACPLIMSSLSTQSALNWGFIRIEKMVTIVDSFSFGLSRLLQLQC